MLSFLWPCDDLLKVLFQSVFSTSTLDILLFVRFKLLFFSPSASIQKRQLVLQLTCSFLCVNIDTHKRCGRCLLDSLQIFRRLETEGGKRGRSVKTFHLLASEVERGRRAGSEGKQRRGRSGYGRFSFLRLLLQEKTAERGRNMRSRIEERKVTSD